MTTVIIMIKSLMNSLQYAKYFTQTISFNKHNNGSLLILSSPSFSFGENEIALARHKLSSESLSTYVINYTISMILLLRLFVILFNF